MSAITNQGSSPLRDKNVAIIPFPAVGDNTIYLRLAQTLTDAGAKVSFHSDLFARLADMLPWLAAHPLSGSSLDELCGTHDLVIADVLTKQIATWPRLIERPESVTNLLATTAKHLPRDFVAPPIPSLILGREAVTPHRPICPVRDRGVSMVEWVDRYALEIFGLPSPKTPPRLMPPAGWTPDAKRNRRVLIFPTTPNPSKNYSLKGFARLAFRLESAGWQVDVICMQHEVPQVAAMLGASRTISFPSLRELILHMMQSHAVISNDSGGGHLGSMLGLATYTITKKSADFVWRPGFNQDNQVLGPVMTFKWFSGRIWRPFIPLDRIVSSLGKPGTPRQTD
jgi:hypothetical protein